MHVLGGQKPRRKTEKPMLVLRPLLLAAAVILVGTLGCGDGGTKPQPRYTTALLAGTWRSAAICPFEGETFDYVLTAQDSVGRIAIRGREQPHACGNFSVNFPPVSAGVDPRSGAVRIETVPQCCTGDGQRFVGRFEGRFADSNTVAGTRAFYVAQVRRGAVVTLTLRRE